jgi:hypothetical protein
MTKSRSDGSDIRSLRRALVCAGALVLLSGSGQTAAGPQPRSTTSYNLYFGDLHTHTVYSDGWEGTPWDAFAAARAAGADFMAVSDHDSYGFWLTPEEWADTQAAANYFTSSTFVAMAAYEFWLAGSGEINIFNTPNFPDVPKDPERRPVPGSTDSPFEALPEVYDWISQQPGAVAQWNHPTYVTHNFFDFDFHTPQRDVAMGLIEVWNDTWFYTEESYHMALDRGWHVMPTANSDTHAADWISGWELRTVLLALRLTPADLYQAMSAGRGYATADRNLRVQYTVNAETMGSILSPSTETYAVSVRVKDPDGLPITGLEIISDGGAVVASQAANSADVTWTPTLTSSTARYFYLRVRSASSPYNVLATATGGGGVTAVTAPVYTGR